MKTTSTAEGKVVVVFGAGFSIPAGAPPQAEIRRNIFHLNIQGDRFRKAKEILQAFLQEDLRIGPAKSQDAPLENIYTPIDRCIADGASLKGKNAFHLVQIRAHLEYLISIAISHRFRHNLDSELGASQYLNDFAHYVVEKAARRADLAKAAHSAKLAKEYDPVSIISLNWDILLENALRFWVSAIYTGATTIHSESWTTAAM
jgi:hypothetical protein